MSGGRSPVCGHVTVSPGGRLWVCARRWHAGSPQSAVRHAFRRLLVLGVDTPPPPRRLALVAPPARPALPGSSS